MRKMTSGNENSSRKLLRTGGRVGRGKVGKMLTHRTNGSGSAESALVRLRHHPSVWLLPAGLLVAALLPWPYGYYNFLRITVCAVTAWLAYTQLRHDDALSGWVVALGAMSVLYNPIVPVHLTRELWSVLNLTGAVMLVVHLRSLGRIVSNRNALGFVEAEEKLLAESAQELGRAEGRAIKSRKNRSG